MKHMYVIQSNGYISEDSLTYLKRYCIWLKDAFYVAGTFCAMCFFLPDVLYLVCYEMGLWIKELRYAYLHVGKTLPDRNEEIYFQQKWLCAKECYQLKRYTLFEECYTLWTKVSVCKACSCQLELVLQEKDACLIVSCSHLQCFHCVFQVGEKTQSWMIFFMWIESLLKGNFAERWRYLEVRKLYLRHSLEGVRTKRS